MIVRWESVATVVLVLLLLAPAGAIAAQEDSPDIEARFTYPEPAMYWEDGILTIEITGCDQHGEPGLPVLPLARERIPLSDGLSITRIELVQTSVDLGPAEGLAIASGYASDDSMPLVDGEPLEVLAGVVDGYALLDLRPVEVMDGRLVWHPSIEVHLWVEGGIALATMAEGEGLDMLIVTNRTLASAFQDLADWKGSRSTTCPWLQDISVDVVVVEDIMLNATGTDVATEVREHIRQTYLDAGIDYVILGGDSECVPPRYIEVMGDEIPTDMYYACLDGTWDADGDGRFGEDQYDGGSGEEMDLTAEVAVGRIPADTPDEVADYVAKLIAYESTGEEAWLNDTLMLGTNLNSQVGYVTWGKEYKDEVVDTFPEDPVLSVSTLYEEDGYYSEDDFMEALASGPHLVNHMGHGSYRSLAFHSWSLTPDDIDGLNASHPFMMFSQACLFGAFDQNSSTGGECLGEEMALAPGGPVSLICNTREGWYEPGGTDGPTQAYDLAFFEHVLSGDVSTGDGLVMAREDLTDMILQSDYYRWSAVSLNLLGDPEMEVRFYSGADYDVSMESLSASNASWGRESLVEATVANMGNGTMTGAINLSADGELVATMELVLSPLSTLTVPLTWTPSKMGVVVLSCTIDFASDEYSGNDAIAIQVQSDLLVDAPLALEGVDIDAMADILVTEYGVLWINDSSIALGQGHGLLSSGEVLANQSILETDMVLSAPSSMQMTGSQVTGELMSDSAMLTFRDCQVIDSVLILNDTMLDMDATDFTDTSMFIGSSNVTVHKCSSTGGAWAIDSSSGTISNSTWDGSEGILLSDCHSMDIVGVMAFDGGRGLEVDNCSNMVMEDLMLQGNHADLVIRGEEDTHWMNQVSNITLTNGSLAYLVDVDDTTVSNASMVVLVSSTNVEVHGCDFSGLTVALTMVGCQGVVVTNCLFRANSLAIDARGSGALIYGCDMLENSLVVDGASECLFDAGYPTGGNYWGIKGVDSFSGPEQDQVGADGIIDSPYDIDGITDEYPSVQSFTSPNLAPDASFTVSHDSVDTMEVVTFTDTSTDDGSIVDRCWDMGDGSTSEDETLSHVYVDDGTYTVMLTVTDNRGETDSIEMQITVCNQAPEASIGCSDTAPGLGVEVTFEDQSTDIDGTISSRSWDFGDGQTSNASSTTHTYSSGGIYTVILTVMDDDGAISNASLIMLVDRVAPRAGFTYQQGDGLSVSFTDTSNDEDGSITSWSWAFGDGTFSHESDPVHSYLSSGEYRVRLQVTDDDGMTDEITVNLVVSDNAPIAAFEVSDTDPLTMEVVELVDRSTDDMGVVAWEWRLGDGNVSYESSTSHAYDDDGLYTVSLTVTDDLGATSSCSMTITVHNRAPTCDPSYEGSPRALEEIEFVPGDGDLDGAVVAWLWDFGDLATATDASPTHHYHLPGLYTVTLTVFDDDGASANASLTIDIAPLPPTCEPSWSVPDPMQANQILLSSHADDPDGAVASVIWTIGDQVIANGSQAMVCLQAGPQVVGCTVIDSQGLSATQTMSVLVSLPDLLIEGPLVITVDGKWVHVSLDIRCAGSWDLEGIGVSISLDGTIMDSTEIDMSSGSCDAVDFMFQTSSGTHTIVVEVDGGDLVVESDEGGNTVTRTITIQDGLEGTTLDLGPLIVVVPVMLLAVVAMYVLTRKRR